MVYKYFITFSKNIINKGEKIHLDFLFILNKLFRYISGHSVEIYIQITIKKVCIVHKKTCYTSEKTSKQTSEKAELENQSKITPMKRKSKNCWHIGNITQEKFSEEEVVRSLLMGKITHTLMYAINVELFKIFEPICCFEQPLDWKPTEINPHYYNVRWKVRVIQMHLENNLYHPEQDFYLNILDCIENNNFASTFATLTSENNTIPESVAKRTIEELLTLQKSFYRGLVYALQPSITKCLQKIPPSKLFNSIYDSDPFELLEIYRGINNEAIQYFPCTKITSKSITSFLSQLILLSNEKVQESFQRIISFLEATTLKRMANTNEFIFQNDSIEHLILTNDSVSKGDHFIQIQWKNALFELTHEEKTSKFSTNIVGKLYPYFFVACFDRIYPRKDFLTDRMKYFQRLGHLNINPNQLQQGNPVYQSLPPEISRFFKAVSNDDDLVAYISQNLGSRKTLYDLTTKSIPLLFVNSIPKIDKGMFDRIFNNNSYLLSEEEMRNSESFLYASKIYYTVIDFVVGNRRDIPDDLINYLNSCIPDDYIRNAMLMDLFSLIFLKDSKGNFFCDIQKAFAILSFVPSRFPESQRLNDANRHIIYAQLRKKEDLQSALVSNDSVLIELIESNQLDLALTIASSHPRYKTLISLIIALKRGDFANVDRSLYSIELNLSKNLINDWISDLSYSNSEYFNSEYFNASVLSSAKHLIERHKRYKDPIGFIKINPNYFHTTTFNEYIELYQKFQHKSNDRLNPYEIIKIIKENDIYVNMKNLNTLLGTRALEFVLIYSKDINERMFNLIHEESPLTAQAIRYDYALNKIYQKDSNSNSVYEKFLASKCGIKEDSDFEVVFEDEIHPIIDQADTSLMPLTEEEVNDLIEQAIHEEPLNINLLNEMFIRAPKQYIKKMKNYMYQFTIPQLLDIYPFCGMRSLPLLDRLNISSLSIPTVIDLLMDTMQWNTITMLINDFKSNENDFYDTIPTKNLSKSHAISGNYNEEEEEQNEDIKEIYLCIFNYLQKHPEMIEITPSFILEHVDVSKIKRHQEVVEQEMKIESLIDLIEYLESNEDFHPSEVIEHVNRIFQTIVIDDFQKEVWTGNQIHKILGYLGKKASTSFVTKLRALSSLLSKSLYARFNESISLRNFRSEKFGLKMASISLKYDFFQECLDFCAAWSLDISLYKAERAKAAFLLGLVDDGYEFIVPPIRNDVIIDQIVDILSHTFVFDMSSVATTENEIEVVNIVAGLPSAQERWREVCEGLSYVLAGSPQIRTLHKILVKLNSIDKLVMFYAASGNFEDAFDAWGTIQRHQTKSDLFIRSIVYPALISKNWNSLWFKVKKIDSMKPFVMDLFKYLDQKKMGLTAYLVQMRLCLYDHAYKTAVKYFPVMKSWEEQEKLVNQMKDAAKRSDSHTNMVPRLDFELQLIHTLVEEQIPFANTLNILTTKENALNVAVYYLKKGEVEVVMSRLVPMMIFTLNEACHALLDDVMQGEMGALHKFFMSIEKADAQTYEVIVMNLFQAIKIRVADPGSLSRFIDANVRDDLKGQVFITFDFLEEAYNIAKKTNDRFLMQLILENAERKGDEMLCIKVREDLK
ncbi:hypothetical protein TRFO_25758 [Tritrichomonas foetus]|uniref:Uncharacterized protein n=1 Tax=Tritrichomonas foetus TaxID=1144522 RepID=A0A1J4K5R2_9EUKA|nr:hypothetical protein TRFO_25758 [Tritrichomonas foetus]|eukprot:OHT06216.1 hypothetical protein TRFO_25758 [Tritrichomonas foetus]